MSLRTTQHNFCTDIFKSTGIWEEETRHLHVTIQTILDLEPGQVLKCLCFDRNFGDLIDGLEGQFEVGETAKASDILQDCYYLRYTKGSKKDSIEGDFIIACGIEEIDCEDDRKGEWLHVEYQPDCWYPFQNGVFEVIDPQLKEMGHERRLAPGKDRKWEEFPKNTRLGWRGAMIPIDKMDEVDITMVEMDED